MYLKTGGVINYDRNYRLFINVITYVDHCN